MMGSNRMGMGGMGGMGVNPHMQQGVINLANNFTCGRNYIMGDIVTFTAPYLYPFVVEYSLIATGVIFAMWRSIGSNPRYSVRHKSATSYYICIRVGTFITILS